MSNGTALTTRGPQPTNGVVTYRPSEMQQKVIDLLSAPDAMSVLAPLVPKGVALDEVGIEVYRAVAKNPDILKCTRESVIMAVADCIHAGLAIGKTIHLVPVNNKGTKELQAWTDYKGDIELVVGSGAARLVEAHAVYANDLFEPHLGSNPHIKHVPCYTGPRGALVCFYARAAITSLIEKFAIMRLDEVEAIRRNSKQWNPGKVKECPEWYGLKTAIHRLCKDLPKNRRLAAVLARFDREDADDHGSPIDVAGEIMGEMTPYVEPSPAAISHLATSSDVEESEMPATVAAPETPASAPAAAAPVRDLAWAKAFGYPMKKSPDYGTPLGTFPYDRLVPLRDSILESRRANNAPDRHAELLCAVELLIEDIETREPPPPPAPAPAPSASTEEDDDLFAAPAAGSGAAPAAPATAKPSVREAADHTRAILALLQHPKLTDDERAQYTARHEAARTPELLAALRRELEHFLQQPF